MSNGKVVKSGFVVLGVFAFVALVWAVGETASRDGNRNAGLLLHDEADYSTDRWESDGRGNAKVILAGSFTPTPEIAFFQPVSSTGPQTVVAPPSGYAIEPIRWVARIGATGAKMELYGGGGANIATNPSQALGFFPGDVVRHADYLLGGGEGNNPILPLDSPLVVRETTPVGPVTESGVAHPWVIVNYRLRFIGTATLTPTPVP